jgi:hypothetical protein
MKRALTTCLVLVLAVAPIMTQAQEPSPRAQGPVVVIEATGLKPRVLQATTADRVIFVNRSGRLVHVEFLGSRSQHRVFQVPGQIWAVFHTAGPHPYVVHIESGKRTELHGVVEVGHVPERVPNLPVCPGITVEGVCLEP